jgi:hypothetical protein
MFILISGPAKVEYYPKTPSTTIAAGALVTLSNGKLVPASSASSKHIGVALRGSAPGDAYGDYDQATMIPVLVPSQDAIFEADAVNLASNLVGKTMDLSDSVTVDGTADSHHAVTLVKYLSPTKGYFKINSLVTYTPGA